MKKITSKKFITKKLQSKDLKKIKGGKKCKQRFVIIEEMRDL